MYKRKQIALLVAGMMLAALVSQPSAARAYDGKVQSCVEAVNRHVDLQHAQRVRHVVNRVRRSGIGQVFEIETSVFTPSETRNYSAYCVADSAAAPVKFRIRETAL